MATMAEVVSIESEESDNSVIEVEVPQKTPPPVIDLDVDDIILNVESGRRESLLAKDIIEKERLIINMTEAVSGESCTKTVNSISPDHWTSDMIKFYNDDWGDEDEFIVQKIQNSMDKSPSLWEISTRDRYFLYYKVQRCKVRCTNCFRFGHKVSMCPDPPYEPKCHMCGVKGHLEYNCPYSKCLNCGNRSKKYVTCCRICRKDAEQICSRCHLMGHSFVNCSDHWRLYHLTTSTSSIIIPDRNVNKPERDIWCCNCGKLGHPQNNCNERKDCSSFTDNFPFVASYKKAFTSALYHTKSKGKRKRGKKKKKRKNKKDAIRMMNPKSKIINK